MLNSSQKHSNAPELRKPVPFLALATAIEPFRSEIDGVLTEIIDQSAFIQGKHLDLFEKNFASFVGEGSHVVGCANGTDAITTAVRALNLPRGSTAVIPAMTYVATAAALVSAGLKLKLVDVEEGTWLIDLKQLDEAIDSDTRLVVPVYLYGQMPAMDQLSSIVESGNCFILEDAAQAQGAAWQGNPVGYWGDIATYSFFPGKNLGAFGDAGGILSRNKTYIQQCRRIGNQGGIEKYEHVVIGRNSRLDNIQAAVLNIKLQQLEKWNERRREIAKQYCHALKDVTDLTLPKVNPDALPVFHQFVVCHPNRDKLRKHLTVKEVQTGIHYPHAIHQLPAFSAASFSSQKFPVAERLAAQCLSLPICPTLSDLEVSYVIDAVRAYRG